MNKLVKGAIATGVGVVLLMGGAGTLAYWNGSASIASQTITAGNLTVSAGTGVWKSGSTTINPANFRTVPGDTLTYTVPVTVTSSGDNLKFDLGLSTAAITAATPVTAANTALKEAMTAGATFAIDTTATNNVTLVSGVTYKVNSTGTSTFNVIVTVTNPFGTATSTGASTGTGTTNANATQNGIVVLGSNALTVTQVQ